MLYSKFTSPAMKNSKYTDQELLELIKENKDNLKYVYKNTKDYSLRFMKKMTSNNNVSDEVLEDIFHDAILVLYEKIRDGKFELKASFQTYLNSVCRYSLLNIFKKKDKEPDFLDDKKLKKIEYDDSITDTLDLIPEFNSPKMTALVKALNTLKENSKKCFELLEVFWFEKMSMNHIADKLGYSNAASAKNQKAKCQKRLIKLAFKLIEE